MKESEKMYEAGKAFADGIEIGMKSLDEKISAFGVALTEAMNRSANAIKEYQAMLAWLSSGEDTPEKRCVRRMIERENKRREKQNKIHRIIDKLKFWKKNER